jgi:hypothetical protein
VRPGFVLAKGNRIPDPLINLFWGIRMEELAATMVEAAVNGSEEQVVENVMLRELGGVLVRAESARN